MDGRLNWLPIAGAPQDGTLVWLLISPDDSENPLDDSSGPTKTIGFNECDHNGEDDWFFAGWSWEQDCFTAGHGTPIGWLPTHEVGKIKRRG